MNLLNRTILITGASTGIGKALAIELSKTNCRLVLTSRRDNLIHEYRKDLLLNDDQLLILQNDVSSKESCEQAYRKIIDKFGTVDVVILNAGFGHNVNLDNFDSRYAEEIFGANVMGIIYWVEQLLPDFKKREQGIIAATSSMADNRGYSGSGFYCASKAAATIFLEGLRVEAKAKGIKVITIRPGFVKTPMTDKNNFEMPFLMPAEKAAKVIIRGIEKEKRVIQFPFPTVMLTKLSGLLPGWLYEFLAARVNVNK